MPETARRWLVVTGCFMGVLTGPVLVASTFSIFFATLLQSERWSRVGIAFAYSLYIVVYGLSGPVVGRCCERFGPKRVVLGGAVLIAGGFALLGLAREVWQFCVLYGLLGVTAGMTGIVPVATLVFRWFASNRGLGRRIWSELAGRPDANGQTIRPEPDLVVDLIDRAIKVGRHEAIMFGLDAPSKSDVVARISGQPMSDEELDQGLARLTEQERETFMILLAKLEGRWVEPPPPSIETTASVVTTVSESEPSKTGPEAEPRRCMVTSAMRLKLGNKLLAMEAASLHPMATLRRDRPQDRIFSFVPGAGDNPQTDEGPIYNNGVRCGIKTAVPSLVD